MITIEIEEDDLLDLLMTRFADSWNDGKTYGTDYELFARYYEGLIDSGVFDGAKINISEIVDNDYVNETRIVTEDELLDEFGYDSLDSAYDDGIILAEYNDHFLISTR